MQKILRVMFLSLLMLIINSMAYSDNEIQGKEMVSSNVTSSSVSMIDVLSIVLSKLEGMDIFIPDQFQMESFDSQWKIQFCSNNVDCDEFLLDKTKDEFVLVGEKLNVLQSGVFIRQKQVALIEIFTKIHTDAILAYGEIIESDYSVYISLLDGFLYVDYELKDPQVRGGGPHYKIDFVSFEVLEKRYDQ